MAVGCSIERLSVDIKQVPIPTAEEIAHAPTVPICSVASKKMEHLGELVRVRGTLSIERGRSPLFGAECEAPLLVMFGREVGRIEDLERPRPPRFSGFFSKVGTRLNYRADVLVVGRLHRSILGEYIGHDRNTVMHSGAMLSIHAVETVREPRPTVEQIAHAPTLPFCTIADGDMGLDGQLVRVKGTYSIVAFHVPFLGAPRNEACGYPPVSLSYDDQVERFTRDSQNKFRDLDSWREVTIVGRVDLHRPWMMGQWSVELTVFAIDGVERRN